MMGFSQGACLTAEYALRHPGTLPHAHRLHRRLVRPAWYAWKGSPGMLAGTRVLITGSDVDDWIPEARVHETRSVFESFGADVETRIYHGRPHEVSDAELPKPDA